jgi:4-carboxymuconolactone decarboxylase
MTLDRLDAATRALVSFSGAIALGHEDRLDAGGRACREENVPAEWVDELLLQSTLMVGWPRALIAAGVWRSSAGPAVPGEDGGDYSKAAAWRERGEAVCRTIYGENYARLRENVRTLHPSLEAWMVVEGYGRTLGREGLDLARRELCVAVQVAVQGAERQLHSHLKGALHAGVSVPALDQALDTIRPWLGPRESAVLAELWRRIGTP